LGATEDCLFLDVYAPTKPGPHPVLVFIKGGGFNTQSPNMNASSLIEAGDHDIVVVQINYRVGPWGFLASKEIKAGGNLNAGLLDQRFALQWVQKNIDKVFEPLTAMKKEQKLTRRSSEVIQNTLRSMELPLVQHPSTSTSQPMAAKTTDFSTPQSARVTPLDTK
jgi:hypothetical protein